MHGKLTNVVAAWQLMNDEELIAALEELAEDMANHGRVSEGGWWKNPPNNDAQIERLFAEGAAEFLEELRRRLSDLEDLKYQAEELRDDLMYFLEAKEETLEAVECTLDPEEEDDAVQTAVSH